jgi:hypothetical protein
MHLHNPREEKRVDTLFGHSRWRNEHFMRLEGRVDENAFVDYFVKEVGARYALKFRVRFSPEDSVPSPEKRTKFVLIHFSNHPRAALLMKQVMYGASDEVEGLEFSGRGLAGGERPVQLKLYGNEPDVDRLVYELHKRFQNQSLSFEGIQLQTLDWPFVEKHYRAALKQMEKDHTVTIQRLKSPKALQDRDVVVFP